MTLAAAAEFESFSPSHWVAIGAIVAAAIAIPAIGALARSRRVKRGLAWMIIAVLLGDWLVYITMSATAKDWTVFYQKSLPLHICGAGIFLTAWVLLTGRQRSFEIAYFWGVGGTLQAVLTPDLQPAYPSYWFFTYFITHGAIVVGVLYAAVAMKLRLQRWALWRGFVATNLFMVAVGLADWALGANYMFLRHPPRGDSPFFFLPWPWYIAFIEVAGLGMGALLASPFWIASRRARRASAQPAA
jgi:hypothetical integral membrane protein (TIGR02206 family)